MKFLKVIWRESLIWSLLMVAFVFFALGVLTAAAAAEPAPSCIPGYSGTLAAYAPRYEYGVLGRHVYWWCKKPDGTLVTTGFSCTHASGCDFDKFGLFVNSTTAMTAPQRAAAASAAWGTNMTFTCDEAMRAENSDRGRLCKERKETSDARIAVWLQGYVPPVPPVWRVKVSGTALDRPAYPFVNNLRGSVSVGRAVIGTKCDLTKPYQVSGSDAWAEFGTPAVVALCAKVAQ